MLQLCISQELSENPYAFMTTGIRVYSIEEALYHAYHYWRESLDDFASNKLLLWAEHFKNSGITSKTRDISNKESSGKRLLAFLRIIEYFNEDELAALETELETWEHRDEWEKLITRADHLVSRGEPAKALALYRRALRYDENAQILNNMAVAFMQLSNHSIAKTLLTKAHNLQPNNNAISLHYAEALILSGDYERATRALSNMRENIDTIYLQGLLAYKQGHYKDALDYFNKHPSEPGFAHKIADTYLKMRQYDSALASLSPTDHEKIAEIYAAYGHAHLPEAIRHLREAISNGRQNDASFWTKLAGYYRRDYDNERAAEAINKAIPSQTPAALQENVRIKKSLGRMREYRAGLGEVLNALKYQYRQQ